MRLGLIPIELLEKNTMKFEGLQLETQGRKMHRAKSTGHGIKTAERVISLCSVR